MRLLANRVMFQSSTTNGQTSIGVLPNGTNPTANLNLFGGADPANASLGQLVNTGTEVRLGALITGTGTYLPMTFYTGGSERVRVDTAGNVGVGVTPSAWASGNRFIDINASASYGAFGSSDSMMLANAYWNGSNWIRKNANNAWRMVMESSSGAPSWTFQYAGNSTAGSTISWSEAMRIDSSGNVGIGTSSPGYKLSVWGASGTAAMNLVETGVRSWAIRAGGAGTNTFDIADLTAGASRFTIDSLGEVGLGTNSPNTKLHVYGAGTTSTSYTNGDATGATLFLQDSGGGSGNGGQILFGAVQGSFAGIKGFIENGTGPAGALLLQTRSTTGNIVERVRIDSLGNVGIGTSSPNGNLPSSTSQCDYWRASFVFVEQQFLWRQHLWLIAIFQQRKR